MVPGMTMKAASERQSQKQGQRGGAVLRRIANRRVSPFASRVDISGRSTVPSAMPKHAQRQLVDAVGIIKRGAAAGGQASWR